MAGAGSSCSGLLLLPLLGGVLNGEDLSARRGGLGSRVVASVRKFRAIGLLAILGFSALLIGGGALFMKELSRRNSPDLLGGGGEGGPDAESLGDFPGSRRGVPGLLGIRKFLGEEVVVTADRGVSVDR
jgi:hypothetical protein